MPDRGLRADGGAIRTEEGTGRTDVGVVVVITSPAVCAEPATTGRGN